MPKGSVVVYENTAINDVYKAHVKSELDAGRIRLWQGGLDEEADIKKEGAVAQALASQSAVETIAAILLQNEQGAKAWQG